MGIKWSKDGMPMAVTEEDHGVTAGVLAFVFVLFAIIGTIAKACGVV